jgi:hypothetical protein
MYRAAIERTRTLKTWRNHNRLAHGAELRRGEVLCICDKQANRFRKGQRQLGCGKARCMVCHAEKILRRPTLKELSWRARELDQLKDYFGG